MVGQVITIGMQSLEEFPLQECEREWLGQKFDKVTCHSMNTYGEFVYKFSDSPGESHYDPHSKLWAYIDGEPNPEFFSVVMKGEPALVFPK